jgi:hypothetical protein
VLDAPASSKDGFLHRDLCVSLINSVGLFGANTPYLHLETSKLQEVFFTKPKPILTGKLCTTDADSNIDYFLLRDTCVSSTQLKRHIWHKQCLYPP